MPPCPSLARASRARASRLLTPLALAGLACCSAPAPNTFAPVCPEARALPGADQVTYRRPGGGQDLTDVQLSAQITSAAGSCEYGDSPSIVDASLRLTMRFQRGPAAPTRQANIPWFVAVTRGDRILDKRVRVIRVDFPPNVDTATATTAPVDMTFPISPSSSAAVYTIWVGFQLAAPAPAPH